MYQPFHPYRPLSLVHDSFFGYPDHGLLPGSAGAVLPPPAFASPPPAHSPPGTPSPSPPSEPPKSKDLGFGIDRILRGTSADDEVNEDASTSSPVHADTARVLHTGAVASSGGLHTPFPFNPYIHRHLLHPAHHPRVDQQRSYLAFCLTHQQRSGLHPMLGNLTLTQHRLSSASHHATGLSDGDATGTSGSKRKRTWSRAVFSNLQRKGLEKRFDVQKYVTKPDRRQLASLLGLTDAQVKVWFQNRRMKWRHQMETKKKEDKTKPKTKETETKPKSSDDKSVTSS